MSSNSAALVDREIVSGHVEGVDFGPSMWVIARSPVAVLTWVFGFSWSVNGHRSYSEPHFIMLPDRAFRHGGNLEYKRMGYVWTRLTPKRMVEIADKVTEAFQRDDLLPHMEVAVKDRKTLVIDGGGWPLLPARSLGEVAYQAWKNMPERGFCMNPIRNSGVGKLGGPLR